MNRWMNECMIEVTNDRMTECIIELLNELMID